MTRSVAISIRYEDGTATEFVRELDTEDEWVLLVEGLWVTGYDPPNVLRVLSNSLGTREIAD